MSRKSNRRRQPAHTRQGFEERVTLKYAEFNSLSSGTFSTYSYRGNGMYDPYAGVGGAQPSGFDEYMALYKNFRVLGSKMHVRLVPDSNSGTGQIMVILRADANSGATMTTIPDALATKQSKFDIANFAGYKGVDLTMERRTQQMLDLSPDSPSLLGTASADPAVQWDWHLHVATTDGTSSIDCKFAVVITYDVVFSGRKTLELS